MAWLFFLGLRWLHTARSLSRFSWPLHIRL